CAPSARLEQARLQLADEVRVLGERLGELRLDAALARQLVGEPLKLVRRSFHLLVGRGHFRVGGSSPVSVRQIPAAVRRDTAVASAARAPYTARPSSRRA